MNVKKCLVLFLTLCLTLSALCIGVAAESATTTATEKGMTLGQIISLSIGGAVIVLVAVLCIIKRQKLAEALRAYKSEMKKITWFSWKNVVRCTVFVVVCVAVIATVIGLLDFVFFRVQALLVKWK